VIDVLREMLQCGVFMVSEILNHESGYAMFFECDKFYLQ
jgi:hypothetical protein